MENVGQSTSRNKEFQEKFGRERLLQYIIKTQAPVIFDVGAHRGESVAYFKRLFPRCSIYSFEPDPDSFLMLSASPIEGVSYFNLALSDADGSSTFYRNRISHTNSLLKVNLTSRDSIGIAKATAESDAKYFKGFNNEVLVNTVKLDSFLNQRSLGQIDVLKIDVQGSECRVLQGALEALKRTDMVILEIAFFDYYESRTSFFDVERLLLPFGFILYSISELSNNPMNGRTDWAEVVYVKQAGPDSGISSR